VQIHRDGGGPLITTKMTRPPGTWAGQGVQAYKLMPEVRLQAHRRKYKLPNHKNIRRNRDKRLAVPALQ
jgi:hypothetical protein